jgi:hypothetical protein
MPLNLKHQTVAQFAALVRARYRDSQAEETARLAQAILDWTADGSVTDAQWQTAFGLNIGLWNALKARMGILRDQRRAIRNARGE